MNVKELIEHLQKIDPKKLVVISCEGGCVKDDNISILDLADKVILEI